MLTDSWSLAVSNFLILKNLFERLDIVFVVEPHTPFSPAGHAMTICNNRKTVTLIGIPNIAYGCQYQHPGNDRR
jgi:hypothetical protein